MPNKFSISSGKIKFILYAILVAVTLAVYWQVNQFDFINYDDPVYITENSYILSGVTTDGVKWAFGTKHFGLWNPLVWISFMLDYELYGLHAGGYHLTNLLLHILTTLLLFGLFNRMTGAVWKSAFVAAFFALHPLHVESVAWVSERKDVLSAFFWMLTLYLYVWYTEKPAVKRYLLVLCAFVLGLMSKPMVVTLPVIMILLDYWPLKRFEARKDNVFLWQLKEKALFFVLSAISVIVVLNLPQKISRVFDEFNQQSPEVFPLLSRLKNALIAFVTYLEKTFFPYDLAVFYPIPTYIPTWQVAAASFLIISISAAVIFTARRHPYLFVGWFWHAISLLPVIGIIRIGPHVIADRYTYLPSVGIAIMLAWGIPLFFKNIAVRKKVLFPAAVAVLIILSVLTWRQCGYWKDSKTLFSRALQVTSNNYLAHHNMGVFFFEKGKINEAFYHFNKALLTNPNYRSFNSRGELYARAGRYDQAIADFAKAISLNPGDATGYYNRGLAYDKTGQHQPAIVDYNKALSLKKDFINAFINRGIIYAKTGRYQTAIEDFSKAIAMKSDYVPAYLNRAIANFSQGENIAGCADARKACTLGNCATLNAARGKGLCP